MEVALGQLDAQLRPVPLHEQRHADVVLLNHEVRLRALGSSREPELLGSDIAERLLQRGSRGTVCISTSLNQEAIARLRELPGVDKAWPKSALHADVAADVLRAVDDKRRLVHSELCRFLRSALGVTNSVAALLGQSGGAEEALRALADLRSAAAHFGTEVVTAACDTAGPTLRLGGLRASHRARQVTALAAISAAARAAVGSAIGTVDELPANLALVQLAQLVVGVDVRDLGAAE